MKKITSLFLSLVMLLGTLPAYAANIGTAGGTGTTPVQLTTEALTFSVTVPTSLPINVNNQGIVTVSNDVSIVNNSAGPVEIKGVKVEAKSPWSLANFADLSGEKVGTKKFGLSIQGTGASSDGTCAASFASISAGGNINLTYNAYVAPQSVAVSNQNIANVVFTVGWDEATASEPEPITYTDIELNRDTLEKIFNDNGEITELVIPETFQDTDGTWYKVTSVANDAIAAFVDYFGYTLTSVTFPGSVKNIGTDVLGGCDSVTSVVLSEGTTTIGEGAFANSSLRNITIPNSVTEIGARAFYGCVIQEIRYYGGHLSLDEFIEAFEAKGNTIYSQT